MHHWRFCEHGDRISWVRSETSKDAVQALGCLAQHDLGPDVLAKRSDHPDFVASTFDHRLDGVVAGARDDTGELFLLRVTDSTSSRETLVAGVAWWGGPAALDDW